MTLQSLKTKANTILAEFWVTLVEAQDAYYAKHGKYFQLIKTNRVVDGVSIDFEERKPSSGLNSRDTGFSFTEKIPFEIQVNEWTSPDGTLGYIAIAQVELLNGDRYIRRRTSTGDDSKWRKRADKID